MTEQDYRLRHYEEKAAQTADLLRDLADRIEREARPHDRSSFSGTPRHLAAAERVNHELTWGLANLGAYRLFDAAFHADEAERCHSPLNSSGTY